VKKLLIILLLALFLFNESGFFIVVQWAKEHNYEVIREQREHDKLHWVTIPKTDWAEIKVLNNDEMVYKGMHYDVFGQETTSNDVRIYCYADSKEDQLLRGLNDAIPSQVSHEKEEHKNDAKSQIQYRQNEYLQPTYSLPFAKKIVKSQPNNFKEVFRSLNPEKQSPPPKANLA
jgi:hypothetical protein